MFEVGGVVMQVCVCGLCCLWGPKSMSNHPSATKLNAQAHYTMGGGEPPRRLVPTESPDPGNELYKVFLYRSNAA